MGGKYKTKIEFPDGDGKADGIYELDLLPRIGEFVKGLNHRYYKVVAVVHCINDQEDFPDYVLHIKRGPLRNQ